MTKNRFFMCVFVSAAVIFLTSGASAQQLPDPVLTSVNGEARLLKSGMALWEKAVAGATIAPGTRVRAGERSSVLINFHEGGFVKISPLASIAYEVMAESTGKPSRVLSVETGGLWISVQPTELLERYIIETPGGAADTREGAFFIEANPADKSSCVDVFSGAMTVRSASAPMNPSAIQQNTRALFKQDRQEPETAEMRSAFDISNDAYSCREKRVSQATIKAGLTTVEAIETEDGYTLVAISSSGSVSFSGGEAASQAQQATIIEGSSGESEEYITISLTSNSSVAFLRCLEPGQSCASDDECCGVCDNGTCREVKDEKSIVDETGLLVFSAEPQTEAAYYETIVITRATTAAFKVTQCETPPVISEVTAGGAAASEGAAMTIESAECSASAQKIVTWKVSAECGYVASSAVKVGTETKTFSALAEGQTGSQQVTLNLADAEPKTVEISATDSFGNKTAFTFTSQLQPHESMTTPPTIKDVTYGGRAAQQGAALNATITGCDSQLFAIAGKATARCGSVSSVTITQNGAPLRVTGTSDWSASHSVSAEGGSASFRITAKDSRGNESEPYDFDLEYTVEQDPLAPPTLTDVVFDGATVSSGDSSEITLTNCASRSYAISGKASTPCGTITGVSATRNGTPMTVTGASAWSASFNMDATQATDEPVRLSVKAANSAGVESEPFEIEISFEKDIAPPSASLLTVCRVPATDVYEPVKIYRNDLESGKIAIRGAASAGACSLARVEVSLDDGASWRPAEGTSSWSLAFNPSSESYLAQARAVDAAGNISDEAFQSLEIQYSPLTREEELLDIFRRLIQAYIDKNSSGFMDLTSDAFTSDYQGVEDSSSLESSLDNKFIAESSIYLRYQVSTTNVSGNSGQVSFNWDANRATTGYAQSAVFFFRREEEGWRFVKVQDPNTFLRYTSVAAYVVLSADSAILTANDEDETIVYATVRDSAFNLIKDGTTVTFSTTLGWIETTALTEGGRAEVRFEAGTIPGTATVRAVSGSVSATPFSITLKQHVAPPPPGF